jgi:hypothetical protein
MFLKKRSSPLAQFHYKDNYKIVFSKYSESFCKITQKLFDYDYLNHQKKLLWKTSQWQRTINATLAETFYPPTSLG